MSLSGSERISDWVGGTRKVGVMEEFDTSSSLSTGRAKIGFINKPLEG
jgi:hypothetical protein